MKKSILSLTVLLVLMVPRLSSAATPDFHGFVEMDYGAKLSDDTTKSDSTNLFEQRLQLKFDHYFEGKNYLAEKGAAFQFKGDFTVDEYYGGKTDFEMRSANLSLAPMDIVDARLGRQVLTWGTGDYLFVNDLFPKDYESFFIGRDDEYLKRPSDALKISLYPQLANIDVVVSRFTPNTTARGQRLSFYDPFLGEIAGRESSNTLVEPALRMSSNEYALRVYKNIKGNEWALYYFNGFDKNPSSFKDEAARELFYRKLDVYGASWRGAFLKGISNVELGYYHSREDSDGTDRLIPNSKFKILTGYDRDLGNDLKIGLQYLYEQMTDYNSYLANRLSADLLFEEARHLLTQRITKLFKNQTVNVTLFNFVSPSDNDGYVRPSISYDVTDQWKVALGANIPWGADDHTEFGQMKKNKNVFVRARYSF